MLRGYVSEYRACWDSLPSVAKWYVEDYDVAWRREELYIKKVIIQTLGVAVILLHHLRKEFRYDKFIIRRFVYG